MSRMAITAPEQRSEPSIWLDGLYRSSAAKLRLYAFPFAGGDINTFSHWRELLSPEVELVAIKLPGRGNRQNEAIPKTWDCYLKELLSEIPNEDSLPFAFIGYSMGGLLAHAVAAAMKESNRRLPAHLFVLACNPPTIESHSWSKLSDTEMLIRIQQADLSWLPLRSPTQTLRNLPVLRADLQQSEHYCQRFKKTELPVPITTIAGSKDSLAPSSNVREWKNLTRFQHDHIDLDGGHFFIFDNAGKEVVKIIKKNLNV